MQIDKKLDIKKALDFLNSADNLKKFISQDNNEEAKKFLKVNDINVSNEDVIQIGYVIEGIFNDKSAENVSGGVKSEVAVAAVCGSLGIILDAINFQCSGWGQDLYRSIYNENSPMKSQAIAAGIGGVSHVVSGAAFAGAGYGAVKFVKWLKNKKGDK